jgi:spoIIIJ-associated protein
MGAITLEIEDKSIDDAIEKACRDFGVPREKLNIEIISESTGGFLGVLSKKAKIKASLLSFDMDFNLTDDSQPKSETRIKIEPRPETRHEARPEPRAEARSETRIGPRTETRIEPQAMPAPKAPAALATPVVSVSNLSTETATALLSSAKELLSGILSRMSFDCQVKVNETPEKIVLSIEGDESGLLIGRRGQNLDALQYVLNKAINKSDSNRKMISVDSETYRQRREESLLEMAQRVREKVKNTQKPVSLAHMNAHDRRIIHLALQEDESLITKSRGDGEYRKIVVLPARKGSKNTKAKTRQ